MWKLKGVRTCQDHERRPNGRDQFWTIVKWNVKTNILKGYMSAYTIICQSRPCFFYCDFEVACVVGAVSKALVL
uniref:Uncharacterized protein n=1 Tax=Anguilla anguilla TaxID=7936 RepID=A0A0E9WWK6_ANGAN